MTKAIERVTVLGDGGWGTALATVLCGNGMATTLWGHDPAYLDRMAASRENEKFLPGVPLPEALAFEADAAKAIASADLVVSAIPTAYLRRALEGLKGAAPAHLGVVSVTKGIEQETLARPSEILEEVMGARRVAVLSGPSHAEEVARGRPTTVVVASDDPELPGEAQAALLSSSLRVYRAADPVGVELGGALKNVLALAAGICVGLELGDNALSALMTRGIAEMTRLGVALGADPATFAGLSGVGDLIVTCISPHGRNRAVGIELGRGRSLEAILAERETVAEGVGSTVSARALARQTGVEMPITEQVYRVLYEGQDPKATVRELMSREAGEEIDW